MHRPSRHMLAIRLRRVKAASNVIQNDGDDVTTLYAAAMAARRRRHLRRACQYTREGDGAAGQWLCGSAAVVRGRERGARTTPAAHKASDKTTRGICVRMRVRGGTHRTERFRLSLIHI